MTLRQFLALAATLALVSTVWAVDYVGVPGTGTRYPTVVEQKKDNGTIKLVLTGTALRTRLVFNVYAVASYVQEGAGVKTAEELAAADVSKRLHLVMERDLDGKTMAEAFRDAIRLNYPAPAFENELNNLMAWMMANPVKKGEHVFLTHVPGIGCHGVVAGKGDIMIRNAAFSKAIWDIYLGKNNLGAPIKAGLTSRL